MNFLGDDVDSLLNDAMEKLRGQIRTADRVVFLLQEGRTLAIKAAHGGRPGREVPAERVSRAILRRVRRTGRTLFLSDAMADSGLGRRRSIQEIGQRSVICAPLKANGKVVGLVYADTVSLIAAFTPAHLHWINQLTASLNDRLEPMLPQRWDGMYDEPSATLDEEPTACPAPQVRRRPAPPDALGPEVVRQLLRPEPPLPGLRKAVSSETTISILALASFYRALASMLSSGITVHRALDVLSEQGTATATIARALYDEVISGHRLSQAMGRFPKVFSSVQIHLVTVGEETGSLDTLAASLAEHVEQKILLRGKATAALAYPVMVTLFCILGCVLAPPLFLNDFFATLSASQVQLPWITQVVIALSAALWSPFTWAFVLALGWATRLAWRRSRRNERWTMAVEQRLLKTPVLGPVRQSFFLLDFMQTLALQLEAGLRLDKSLLLSAAASGNPYLQERTRWIVESVKSGASLSYALHRSKVFPATVVEFVALGEETGKMSQSCRFAEALLRERAETALETAETLLEPLAICLVGGLVGVAALACMLPLVKMFETFV